MNESEFFANRVFSGLSANEAELLIRAGAVENWPEDAVLLHEGEALDTLFIVMSGSVSVYLPETEHRVSQVRLSTMGANDCFGEYAFIDGQPASASVRTLEPSMIYRISHGRLSDLVESNQDIGLKVYRNLLRILVERLRASNAELDLFTLVDDWSMPG